MQAHLHFAQAIAKFCKRAPEPTHLDRHEMTTNKHDRQEGQLVTGVTVVQLKKIEKYYLSKKLSLFAVLNSNLIIPKSIWGHGLKNMYLVYSI